MTDDPHIVLHLGPEKCGSTSIQAAIAPEGPLSKVVLAPLLDPYAVVALEQDPVDPSVLRAFRSLVETQLKELDDRILVLSHEMSFKSLPILRQLAGLATQYSRNVSAVAYVRRQSDFILSGFGQWHFRSHERLTEASDILRAHGLDPDLFWATERHLIAAILGGWDIARQPSGHLYLNWAQSVPERAKALSEYGVDLKLGVLPSKGSPMELIPDFVRRIGADSAAVFDPFMARNPSYHPVLVEAVAAAVIAGGDMPGPHDANDFFARMSAQDLGPHSAGLLLEDLKDHIDTLFHDANCHLARSYDLPELGFAPRKSIGRNLTAYLIDEEALKRSQVDRETRMRDIKMKSALARLLWKTYSKQI